MQVQCMFKEQLNAQKNNKDSKKKGKHGRFESKSQFIRRRPVSGDKVSNHLKLIHIKDTTKTNDGCKFLKECLLKEVLFQGMDDSMINEIVDVMYLVDCRKGECIIRQNEYDDAYFVIQSGSFGKYRDVKFNCKEENTEQNMMKMWCYYVMNKRDIHVM
eukprot:2899_1